MLYFMRLDVHLDDAKKKREGQVMNCKSSVIGNNFGAT
jgi:hypothetical protein